MIIGRNLYFHLGILHIFYIPNPKVITCDFSKTHGDGSIYRMVPPSDVCWFINPMNTIVYNWELYSWFINPINPINYNYKLYLPSTIVVGVINQLS